MFSNIQGHRDVLSYMEKMIRRGDLPSCVLLHGPHGVGKKTLALEVAKRLNCRQAKEPECTCASCSKINKNDHMDVFLHLDCGKIDQIRAIIEESNRYRMEGEWRVFILDGVENLGGSAADALLKTLEEGRPHTLFILITDAKSSVISTLTSRSLDFYMGPLSKDECYQVFHSMGLEVEEAPIALGAGSVDEVQFYINEGISIRNKALDLLKQFPDLADYKVLSFLKESEDNDRVLDIMEGILLDILILHSGGGAVRNIDCQDVLQALKEKWDWDKCLKATQAFLGRARGFSEHQDKSLLLSLKDILR